MTSFDVLCCFQFMINYEWNNIAGDLCRYCTLCYVGGFHTLFYVCFAENYQLFGRVLQAAG